MFVDLFLVAHAKAPQQIGLDLDAAMIPFTAIKRVGFFHAYYGGRNALARGSAGQT